MWIMQGWNERYSHNEHDSSWQGTNKNFEFEKEVGIAIKSKETSR